MTFEIGHSVHLCKSEEFLGSGSMVINMVLYQSLETLGEKLFCCDFFSLYLCIMPNVLMRCFFYAKLRAISVQLIT